MSRHSTWALALGVLVAALLGACLLSLSVGPASISLVKAARLWREGAGGTYLSIILDIRLPRVLLGIAVGGGLSLSGVVFRASSGTPSSSRTRSASPAGRPSALQ